MNRCYLIDEVVDRYRWVGRVSEADGKSIARVRQLPVFTTWQPVAVDWVSETRNRPVCDFPISFSIVRCFSRRAVAALTPLIEGGVEVLPLVGLNDEYVGVHCIRWLEGAARLEDVDQNKISIHSTNFVPKLSAAEAQGLDIFGVPELITKLFVSERFKDAVEKWELVGLRFREVELC